MRGFNKIFLLGHLGQQPELHETSNGHQFAELRLATNRVSRAGEEWKELTDWHTIKVWDRLAELCSKHLNTGAAVAVEGQIRTETWVNKEGEKRSRNVIYGEQVHFIQGKKSAEQAS
jgi:single-strand DNA-binding protein